MRSRGSAVDLIRLGLLDGVVWRYFPRRGLLSSLRDSPPLQPKRKYPTESSSSRLGFKRFDSLVSYQPARVDEARSNIFGLKPRVAFEDCFRRIARSQHAQYVFDSQSAPADDRLAAENLRIDRNALAYDSSE